MVDNENYVVKRKSEELFYSNQYEESQEKSAKQEPDFYQENISVKMYNGFISLLRGLGSDRHDEIEQAIEKALSNTAPFRAEFKREKIMEEVRNETPGNDAKQSANGERTLGWAGMNYQTLYSVMIALGISYQQLMDVCGYKEFPRLEELPQDVQRVYELVDQLPQAARDGFIRKSALSLTDTFWQKDFWSDKLKTGMRRPSARTIYLFERSTPYRGGEMIRMEKSQRDGTYDNDSVQASRIREIARIYRLRLAHASIDAEAAPAVAEGLKTSIHWLMAMPNTLSVYAQNGITEEIVDAYYFMSDSNKTIFLAALEKFAKQLESLNTKNGEGAK